MPEQATLLRLAKRGAGSELVGCGRRRGAAPRRAGDRVGGAGEAAQSRDRESRRRPCARATLPRSRDARRRRPRGATAERSEPARRGRTSRPRRARPSWVISAAMNSKKPSSSSASRRSEGVSDDGSASSAGSTARTWTWSLPPKRSTRPSTCTASPSPNRWSRRSTSFHTRASTRPLASASSSAR